MNWRSVALGLGVVLAVSGACSSSDTKLKARDSGAGEGGNADAGSAGGDVVSGAAGGPEAGAGGMPAEPAEGGAAGRSGSAAGGQLAGGDGGRPALGQAGGGEGGAAQLAPSITTPADVSTTLATAFNIAVEATGSGPLLFSLESGVLPAGIALDSSTGELSGSTKPEALVSGVLPGQYDVVVRVTNGVGFADTATFSITVTGVSLPTPLAYFTYDTADVNAAVLKDASGNNHPGAISGGVTTAATGAVGQAFTLDGASGLVSAAGVPTPSGPVSLVATVKPSGAGLGSRIPVQYGISDPAPTFRGNWIQTESDGHIYGIFEDGGDRSAGSTTILSINSFTPLGTTWDDVSKVGRLYVGGLQEGTVTTAGPLLYATTNLETGRHPQFAARFWQGSIDEVAMWNVLLSPEQMATVAWLSKTGQSMKTWIGL